MRFKLVWNLALVIGVLLIVVALTNLHNQKSSAVLNLLEVGIAAICLIVLYRTRRFESVSIFASIGSIVLLGYAYAMFANIPHYTTPMWSIVNVLFTYFLLGRWWGLGILSGHVLLLVYYYLFRIQENFEHLQEFNNSTILNMSFETVSVGLALAYLMHSFITANRHAEESVLRNNLELTQQNKIISMQNSEKEIMLKEIHHRIKNNLQVITRLLRLQANELDDENAESFTEAINRVKSMALIHEKMYSSEVLANFNLENFYFHLLRFGIP